MALTLAPLIRLWKAFVGCFRSKRHKGLPAELLYEMCLFVGAAQCVKVCTQVSARLAILFRSHAIRVHKLAPPTDAGEPRDIVQERKAMAKEREKMERERERMAKERKQCAKEWKRERNQWNRERERMIAKMDSEQAKMASERERMAKERERIYTLTETLLMRIQPRTSLSPHIITIEHSPNIPSAPVVGITAEETAQPGEQEQSAVSDITAPQTRDTTAPQTRDTTTPQTRDSTGQLEEERRPGPLTTRSRRRQSLPSIIPCTLAVEQPQLRKRSRTISTNSTSDETEFGPLKRKRTHGTGQFDGE